MIAERRPMPSAPRLPGLALETHNSEPYLGPLRR